MDIYKVSSTGVSINYLPQYIAEKNGYFEDLGLKVETAVPNPWTKVLDDINSGDYHAACGGIWVPNMYTAHNVRDYSSFAKISSRCPFKLVSRQEGPFNWKDLEGKTILVPADGGASAFIFLMGTLKKNNVDTNSIRFIHDFLDHMLVECFSNGTLGDYIFTQAISADKITDMNRGFIVAEMATEGGEVPWSVYYSTIEVAHDERNLNGRFALGIQKGLDYLLSHEGKDFTEIIREKWPGSNIQTSVETIDRFIQEGMWSKSIEINKSEFDNYINYQIDAGIIDQSIPIDKMVDFDVLKYVKEHKVM